MDVPRKNKEDGLVTIITSRRTLMSYVKELPNYGELFIFFTLRELLVRYKQTVLGIGWVVLRPLLMMIIFTVIFSRLVGLSSGIIPYPIFVLSALLPWQFFGDGFFYASNSLINNENLISKIYFPRIVIPASYIMCSVVDFIFSFFILIVLMFYYGCVPSIFILTVPLFLVWNFIFILGVSIFIAALNVKYRDFRHIVPFIVQVSLYVSPVGFSSNLIPYKWRLLYSINPLVGIIDGFRWACTGESFYPLGMIISLFATAVFLFGGFVYFRKEEDGFADVI